MYDLNVSIAALKFLFPPSILSDGHIVLKEIGGRGIAEIYRDQNQLECILQQCTQRKSTLAVGTAVRRNDYSPINGKQGKKGDCSATAVLKVDFDSILESSTAKTRLSDSAIKQILNALDDAPLKPSFIVHSGGGLHAYYCLKEPFSLDSAEKISRIESLNENVMTYFEGKGLPCIIDRSVKDVSRIMRLPGSVNFKYDEPVTSKIVGGSNGQILIA